MKTILITGATSGIGQAVAHRFAQDRHYRMILTGRRAELLEALAQSLRQEYGSEVLTLCFDVRQRESVENHLTTLDPSWSSIDILVNNAGLAVGLEPVFEGNPDDWDRMIDTNVKGLLYVSRCITPGMVARQGGHIFNIGSIAGKQVYPNGAVYCASKHAVDAISQGMRLDLVHHGIKVTQVCPGAVETEFSIVRFKGDQQRADQVYKGFDPLTGEDIAQTIYYCAELPAHVCINDLTIMPRSQASATVFHKDL